MTSLQTQILTLPASQTFTKMPDFCTFYLQPKLHTMLWISHAHLNSTIKKPFKMQHLEGKHVWECGKSDIKNNGENSQCDILTYFNRHLNHNKMYPSAHNMYISHALYGIVTASLSFGLSLLLMKICNITNFLLLYTVTLY